MRHRLIALTAVEFLASTAGTFTSVGLPFYTTHIFHWGLRGNSLMAVMQGIVYVTASLSANLVQSKAGRIGVLRALYLVMSAAACVAFFLPRAGLVIAAVLAYAACAGICWPILESLVAGSATGETLSRRLGAYNVVWSAAGVVLMAVVGAVIEHWPPGVWLIIAVSHLLCVLVLVLFRNLEEKPSADQPAAGQMRVEVELLHHKRLAMWLSRITLPATYMVMIALAAMLPTLPAIAQLRPTIATLTEAVWMAARVAAFALLGATTWWHTRPRMLLWGCVLMLISFLAGIIPPSRDTGAFALGSVVFWQIGLGFAFGYIYSASLYFGLALSEGSTEHSGYHEALIGLGAVLGPGSCALAAWIRPGQPLAAVGAVGAAILISLAIAAVAAVRAERSQLTTAPPSSHPPAP
ncbi:MAG: MFS transporter [Tepidisphaerales bacterium]